MHTRETVDRAKQASLSGGECCGDAPRRQEAGGEVLARGDPIVQAGRRALPNWSGVLANRAQRADQRWEVRRAAERKLRAAGSETGRRFPTLLRAGYAYLARLQSQSFRGIVLDYDRTLAAEGARAGESLAPAIAEPLIRLLSNGITVGVATGRGPSVAERLCATLPRSTWPRVVVGCFNGAWVGDLNRARSIESAAAPPAALDEILNGFRELEAVNAICDILVDGPQVRLKVRQAGDAGWLERFARGWINQWFPGQARVVSSRKNITIVPRSVSKLRTLQAVRSTSGGGEVLAIGDRGDVTGNDFELLSEPTSLSVAEVSPDPGSCWNFLPEGCCYEKGTAWYLSSVVIAAGAFVIGAPRP